MTNLRAALLTIAIAAFLSPLGVLAKDPVVESLSYRYSGGKVLVSFKVAGAFDREDIRETLTSTRPITITYFTQLQKSRAMWKDKVIARKTIKRIIQYDNLTRQFTLKVEGGTADEPERVVDTWEELVTILSSIQDVVLTDVVDLEAAEELYKVRAKVLFLSDSFLWIIPWDLETDWGECWLKTP